MRFAALALAAGLALLPPPAPAAHARKVQRTLTVTATAYNSTVAQTDALPFVGAWGDRLDRLKPAFRAIAVSPDLVARGLKRGRRVRIAGFKGEFLVLDRTPAQWQNRIDIHMGTDVAAARRFGRKTVKIFWSEPARRKR